MALASETERLDSVAPAVVEPGISGVSWPAVAAGAVANIALTLLLVSFGIGVGFSVASPYGASVSPTTFKIATGIYFIVMAMIGGSIGGYIAGRLRTKWTGVHGDEVYFRDTAHGFLSWAFAAVVGFLLLTAPVGAMLGNAPAQTGAAADKYANALLRTDNSTQAPADVDRARADLSRTLATATASGDVSPADRAYVQSVVAARTGLSPADADKRVSEVSAQMKADLETARKAAASLALWLTAAMVIGAFCASLAATEGGSLRDRVWTARDYRS